METRERETNAKRKEQLQLNTEWHMDGFSDSYVHISMCPVMRLSEWLNWMRFHKLVLPQGCCVWLRQLAETENFADLEPQVLFCFSSCPCKGQWWHCWYRKSIKLWRNMWSPPPLNFFFVLDKTMWNMAQCVMFQRKWKVPGPPSPPWWKIYWSITKHW